MIKKGIGYSSLSETVYLGRQDQEKGIWKGEKEDITSDFLFVLEQYIPKQTTRTVRCGNTLSVFFHIENTKEGCEKGIAYLQKKLSELKEENVK